MRLLSVFVCAIGLMGQTTQVPTPSDLRKYAGSKVTLITDDPSTWSAQRHACHGITLGQSGSGGAVYGTFVPWAADSAWTTPIANAAVDPNSDTWIAAIDAGAGGTLRWPIPTGVSDGWGTVHYGIPLTVVDSSTPKMTVRFDLASNPTIAAISTESYPSNSDTVPIQVPIPPAIQETTEPGSVVNYMVAGDKHFIEIDRDNCIEIEAWNAFWDGTQLWAGGLAIFDLLGPDTQRPYGWSSSSVSGVSQYAGMVTVDEVLSGLVKHALATTALQAWGRAAFTPPASAHQWNSDDPTKPPFGARLRLKSSFDISPYGPQCQVLLRALQEYGAVYVDGGIAGDGYWAEDSRWNWNDFAAGPNCWHIPLIGNMEFVQAGPIYSYRPEGTDTLPPTGAVPTISTLAAYPATVRAGSPAIVFWSASGGSGLYFLSGVGALRQNYAIVYPAATTTYTLSVQNRFGRSTRRATVTVTP